jgi:adenylate cyclase
METLKRLSPKLIKPAICLFISLIVIVVSQEYIFSVGPIKELEQKHIDERFRRRGPIDIKDTAQVVIVEITQNTYDAIPNKWPWPRDVYAKVIENLNSAGAKAIGIDIVMSNPINDAAAGDSALFHTIRKYKNVVVSGKTDINEGNVVNKGGESVSYQVSKTEENYNNIFYRADSSIGIVQIPNDNDGVIRRYMPYVQSSTNDALVPTLSFAVLNKYFNLKSSELAQNTPSYFKLHERNIPKFDNTSMLINYYGPSRSFKYIDFAQILDDHGFKTKEELELGADVDEWDLIDKSMFKDKIILIGSTMPEDKDIIPVSFSMGAHKGDNLMNGVEIHANAIQNILTQNYITREPISVEILIVILLTFLTFYFSSLVKSIKFRYSFLLEFVNLLVVTGLFVGSRQFSFYLFEHNSFLATIVSANMAILFAYIGSTVYHFISERKQKGMIKGMFSQYVNATIVDELIANPDSLQLGGRRQNLSVFFSDIAGFSTFSENKEPEDLISFLNEYLSEMTKVVFENKGTLDKYVGDAVMAFWGAPVPIQDHAYYACKSALEMQARLVELKEKWRKEGQPVINARMGINSGDMVVGNVGGTQRFDYTVMGDAVNLASRLEGANKQYGTYIMVSESTYEMVKDRFFFRELDNLVVKGKTKPIKVYEVMGYQESDLSESARAAVKVYNEALQVYSDKKFSEAIPLFEKALSVNPNDGPSRTYLSRCQYLIANPPAEDWDGVFHMTTK